MNAQSLYHWDYDRRLPSGALPFLTFSIAIFQWQPKSAGKGLKKVNASRVHGYAIDPQRVYAKAQEICDRLNASGANVANRPQWLQKQYSVPKPTHFVVERAQRDLPGSVVRSIRQKVMERILIPAGFVKGKAGTYVRRQGDQIHLIDFQAAIFGHEYFVNLAFHYAFMPPLFAQKRIGLAKYCQLDCGLSARIADFIKAQPASFEYGTDRSLVQHTFEKNAEDCLNVFASAAKRLAIPKRLLCAAGCELNSRLMRPWRELDSSFAPLLALRLGRRQAAIRELRRLAAEANGGWSKHYQKRLATAKST